MLNFKTLQSFVNTAHFYRIWVLKFCYFLVLIVFISCEQKTEEPTNDTSKEKTETTSELETNVNSKKILFFGDSITAGYGLDDVNDAYPALIQKKIDSLQLDYEVINSGVSGETTAGGRARIDWILNQDIDIFVLELGANDGLRGVAIQETRDNLQAIIDAVKTKDETIKIVLAGMQLPPNMGQDYTSQFKAIFSDLASQNEIALIPFILKDVGGIKSLNQSDGIHPTQEGHKIVANTVWDVLQEML